MTKRKKAKSNPRGGIGRTGMKVREAKKVMDIKTKPSGKVLVEGKHVRFVRRGYGIVIEPTKESVVLVKGRKVVVSRKTGEPRKEWIYETQRKPRFKSFIVSYKDLPRIDEIIKESKLPKYAKEEALKLLPKAMVMLTMV